MFGERLKEVKARENADWGSCSGCSSSFCGSSSFLDTSCWMAQGIKSPFFEEVCLKIFKYAKNSVMHETKENCMAAFGKDKNYIWIAP